MGEWPTTYYYYTNHDGRVMNVGLGGRRGTDPEQHMVHAQWFSNRYAVHRGQQPYERDGHKTRQIIDSSRLILNQNRKIR